MSDHDIVLFNINVKPKRFSRPPHKVYLYDKADMTALRKDISIGATEFFAHCSRRSLEENWSFFKDTLNKLADKHIPSKLTSSRNSLPWISRGIRRQMRRRDHLLKKARRSSDKNSPAWSAYRLQRNKVVKLLKSSHDNYLNEEIGGSLKENPKRFWSFIKRTRSEGMGIPTLRQGDSVFISDKDKANLLNKQFESVFTRDNGFLPSTPSISHNIYSSIGEIKFDEAGVRKLLTTLNTSKSCGPDGISARCLRDLSEEISGMLTFIFQQSFNSGTLPYDWSQAMVVPVHKKSNKENPANYRPISLTCLACKLMEHIVLSHLNQHLSTNSILSYSDWVCTAVMSKWRHERSSRLIRNLSNCEREAWKKFRLQRDSNPWPLRYRCSALPTELWSHNCWEQVNFSGSIMPLRVIQHYSDWVCTAVMSKWRHERSSRLIRNLSNCEREAWRKFRLQRDSNPWPLRYRCSALPTELWSHNCWEQVNFSGSIMPLRVIQHYSDWVCTAVMSKWRHERSSRLIRNLSNCEREAWKKFRLQRDSNPWPLRYRCSALPTELWSHNCWEQVNFSGSIMPLRVIQHYSDWVCTAVMSKWRHERSSRLIRNLSNCEREAWKKFRLQRDSNPWPLRYRCSALPTELWSHNCWEQVNFSGSIMPLRVIQHYSDWVCNPGSNPAEAWIFFRLLFRNCLNCVSTAKIFHDVIYS